jgi:hypothetical protein
MHYALYSQQNHPEFRSRVPREVISGLANLKKKRIGQDLGNKISSSV